MTPKRKRKTQGSIHESFDRDVADFLRDYPRPKTFPIQFEWNPPYKPETVKARCWNGGFWYGDGTVATEPSVIVRKSDFDRLLKDARAAKRGGR